MSTSSLIVLANAAKTAGCYPVANAIVAVLLDRALRGHRIILEHEADEYDAYYDLLNVVEDGSRVCIPVPMLREGVIDALLDGARVVERLAHDRTIVPCSKAAMSALDGFLTYASPEEAADAIRTTLVDGEESMLALEVVGWAEQRAAAFSPSRSSSPRASRYAPAYEQAA